MNIVHDKDRQVIPRWRSFKLTTKCGQLKSFNEKKIIEVEDDNFLKRLNSWQNNKDISHAADLVSTACVTGRLGDVNEAVNFIKKNKKKIRLLTDLINNYENNYRTNVVHSDYVQELYNDAVIEKVRDLRKQLALLPNDPISWTDLSHHYVLCGQHKKAVKAITVALNLAPNNRFILRSASRLFIHLDDPQKAHNILRTSELLKHDPWIMSAEIAVAHAAKRSSKIIKYGKKIISSNNLDAWHATELMSAIATLELQSGKHKDAKKLFQKALVDPTENSIAQVSWASRRDKGILLPKSKLEIPNTFEARYWHYYNKGDWKRALLATKNWFADQPFSSRPAIVGSFLTTSILEDYQQCKYFCKQGLISNPNNIVLQNNYAFYEIQNGNIEKASSILSRISMQSLSSHEKAMCIATLGLLNYRKNRPDEGRSLYLKSIEIASSTKDYSLLLLATCFYAIEEANYNTRFAKDMLDRTLKKCGNITDPGIIVLIERAKKKINTKGP